MTARMTRRFAALAGAAVLAGAPVFADLPASAPEPPVPHAAGPHGEAGREAKVRNDFTNTVLLAHDGRSMRFYEDVLKDRVVLIHFVPAGGGEACERITRRLRAARRLLGDDVQGVRFVSISADPAHETPQSMAEFARRYDAVDPEWLWMTGEVAAVELVTRRLVVGVEGEGAPFSGLLIGNLKTDRWRRVREDAQPELIAAQVRLLAGRRSRRR